MVGKNLPARDCAMLVPENAAEFSVRILETIARRSAAASQF
jgi:hypothetical protein